MSSKKKYTEKGCVRVDGKFVTVRYYFINDNDIQCECIKTGRKFLTSYKSLISK